MEAEDRNERCPLTKERMNLVERKEYNIPAETFMCSEVYFDWVTYSCLLNFSGDEGNEKDQRDEQVKLDLI